uniref:Uncharacterized protein n=1 Tax=Paenarthrobacter nicotinovorans TaxID=29320 RepID=Q8GAB3_PAENI|nr:hypothetical protein [Paenarthrobacter nicotinovorans]
MTWCARPSSVPSRCRKPSSPAFRSVGSWRLWAAPPCRPRGERGSSAASSTRQGQRLAARPQQRISQSMGAARNVIVSRFRLLLSETWFCSGLPDGCALRRLSIVRFLQRPKDRSHAWHRDTASETLHLVYGRR